MQIAYHFGLTSKQYVNTEAWKNANIEQCPLCSRKAGQGFSRHGTYQRKFPEQARITRYYCKHCQTTFSLLPECLASHFGDTLEEIHQAVAQAKETTTFDQITEVLRSDIELQGARRWLRRRLERTALAFELAATTLAVPVAEITWPDFRRRLESHLKYLPTPLGFDHRQICYWKGKTKLQHSMGPDPPI